MCKPRLALHCKLAVTQQAPSISQPKSSAEIFSEFYNERAFSDVVLTAAGGARLHAHKVVLAAHSEPIKAMLQVKT